MRFLSHLPAIPRDLADLLVAISTDFPTLLPDDLVGIYLWGSLTYDAFDETCSDVDLVCVTRCDLDDGEFQKLAAWFTTMQGRNRWVARIDMRFVIDQECLDTNSKCCGFYHCTGKMVRHGSDANPIIWLNVAQCGISLWGTDAKTIAPPVSDERLNDALLLELDYLKEALAANVGDRSSNAFRHNAYAVLTACRILYSARHRALVSKDQACAWAMQTMPPQWQSVIQAAKLNRLRYAGETTSQLEQEAIGFVAFITEDVIRALGSASPSVCRRTAS